MTGASLSRKDPERQRPEDLETAILEAARDLLAARGLEGLSMRAVAERVGVSAPALYHYFSSKQDLVDRVLRRGFARFGEYLERFMASHPPGSLRRVRAIGEAYLRFSLENQAYFRVLFSVRPSDERTFEDVPGSGGYQVIRQAIVDAMEAGTIRRADPDVVALFLWSTVHGLVTLSLTCGEPGAEAGCVPASPLELFEAFAPLIADGIRVREGFGGGPRPGVHSFTLVVECGRNA